MTEFIDRWGERHALEVKRNGDTFDVIADGVKVFNAMVGGELEEEHAINDIKYFLDLVQPSTK